MSIKPVVGYWKFRGIAQPIRLLLASQGVDFEDRRYSKGADGKGTEWLAEKFTLGLDFPNLPYYIEGDVKLTQTLAILRYLGRKYKLDGTTEQEKNRIALLEQQVSELSLAFFRVIFGSVDFDKAKAQYLTTLPDKLKQISAFLGTGEYVAGRNISYVDFWLYEYLVKILRFAPVQFGQYSNLQQFVTRLESQPKLAEYLKKSGPQPFIDAVFKWNDKY